MLDKSCFKQAQDFKRGQIFTLQQDTDPKLNSRKTQELWVNSKGLRKAHPAL